MELKARIDRPQDRLATAVFIAALLHGLLILGVRFTASPAARDALPTLEVLLVQEGPSTQDPNLDAVYMAQRSQQGAGNTQKARRTSLPESSSSLIYNEGEAGGDALQRSVADDSAGVDEVVTARQARARSRLAAGESSQSQVHATPMEARPVAQVGLNATAADEELRLRGKAVVDDRLLPDTRESQIAAYLDAWKRRIERVGTLNFPNEARRRSLSGNPVIEVVIHADGRLQDVVVRRSSGHREIDNAALGIVRLALPFDPFPPAMRASYPQLRFAYEWQFIGGRLGGGTLLQEAP